MKARTLLMIFKVVNRIVAKIKILGRGKGERD